MGDPEIDNTLPTEPEAPIEPPTEPEVPPTEPAAPVEEAKYPPPDPPDVYQDAPVQVTEPGTTADPETGLPENPREPYPVGDGPVDAGKVKGVS